MQIAGKIFFRIFSYRKYGYSQKITFYQGSQFKSYLIQHKKFSFLAWVKTLLSSFEKMEISHEIAIPSTVRHMEKLDREAFTQKIVVPSIVVDKLDLQIMLKKKKLKVDFLLKILKLNPVIDFDDCDSKRKVLLSPFKIKSKENVDQILLENKIDFDYKFLTTQIDISYENWTAEQILNAILPEETDGCGGHSMIGHILHLNLKDHLLPYKYIIADVLLDKIHAASLIVNKTDTIDNTFRSFQMEKLAGEGGMVATLVEYGVTYTLDFSKVYWNSRLGAEHNRITGQVKKGDVMYDIMAGIGPFAIPAAKRGCTVLANDLNPFSYEYMEKNVVINKVQNNMKCYNMDGNLFIKTVVKDHLLRLYEDDAFENNIHIPMNLPAIAVTFLPSFIGLLADELNIKEEESDDGILLNGKNLPIIHVYMFSHNKTREFAMHVVAKQLGFTFNKLDIIDSEVETLDDSELLADIDTYFINHVKEVVNVRRVAPAKIMIRVSFSLPSKVLLRTSIEFNGAKRIKLS